MKIRFNEKAGLQFLAAALASGENEFSGLGFCHVYPDHLEIYELRVLDYGTYASTNIPPEVIAALLADPELNPKDLRAWLHKHPIGSGKPGADNWSSTDNLTIETQPLGGVPELVGWSAAVVLTPHGPVGRIDNHLSKKTVHVPVELPFVDLSMMLAQKKESESDLRKVISDLEWLLDEMAPALAEAINDLEHLEGS